jgi:endoribonuclease Dicer
MVSNSVLAAICVWSGLYKHLIYDSYVLAKSIREYVHKLETNQVAEYEAAEREGRTPGQYWLDIEPPKVRRSSSARDTTHSSV